MMKDLVNELVDVSVLKTPRIINAFLHIDRAYFVAEEYKQLAYINEPLPIGYGQTISQPWTVAFMIELLDPRAGQTILDIGSGSGWQTALLSYIVCHDDYGRELAEEEQGKVIGLERIPELAQLSAKNIAHYSFLKKKIAEIHCINAEHGYARHAPYNRIIVAASGRTLFSAWKEQLAEGGSIVAPLGETIHKWIKKDGDFFETTYEGFSFVPFVSRNEDTRID